MYFKISVHRKFSPDKNDGHWWECPYKMGEGELLYILSYTQSQLIIGKCLHEKISSVEH